MTEEKKKKLLKQLAAQKGFGFKGHGNSKGAKPNGFRQAAQRSGRRGDR